MPELLAWNFYREVVELVRRPTAMRKIHYFSVGHQFFKISPILSLFMTGAENLFIYWSGKRQFQQIYQTGKRPGRISLGHLDKVYQNLELSKSKSKV